MSVEKTPVKKWGFWRRWKWRLRVFRYMGILGLFFPYNDTRWTHVMLGSLYAATMPLLPSTEDEMGKAPFLKESYLLANELIEPYIYGEERIEKRGDVGRVIAKAEEMFSYVKDLEKREPYASWLLREIVSGYLIDLSTAFDFLHKAEHNEEFHRLAKFFLYLAWAFSDLDEEELREAKKQISQELDEKKQTPF
jgi:hypothetical protein